MSISPLTGQLASSVSQKAGQVPHPAGMCRRSMMKSPRLKRRWPSRRMELRGPWGLGLEERMTKVSVGRSEGFGWRVVMSSGVVVVVVELEGRSGLNGSSLGGGWEEEEELVRVLLLEVLIWRWRLATCFLDVVCTLSCFDCDVLFESTLSPSSMLIFSSPSSFFFPSSDSVSFFLFNWSKKSISSFNQSSSLSTHSPSS
mmetsp:Transcript_29763/g.59481  ORF Transcript_29763/g.59481 Transcript_29763/m.59481 type:complete len:200 (-) Transcript_29763:509-1108(-)